MLSELRERLTSLSRSAAALEQAMADSRRVPPMDLAHALVETERLQTRLAKLEALLARSAGGSA